MKFEAERKVSFDNGPDSSVAEDTYFGLLASSQGYSFDFIQGNMCEKSPFDLMDFLQQRKRWLQGLLLVVHSSKIPLRYYCLKFFLYVPMTYFFVNFLTQISTFIGCKRLFLGHHAFDHRQYFFETIISHCSSSGN